MQYEQILYETQGRIARITANRPRYRNAQSRLMLEEMDAAFTEGNDPEVRVIVLAGAGEHFSSGHDIGTAEELADKEARPYPKGMRGELQRSWDLYVAMSLRWRDVPKPTIAQVQGLCIYGGFIIASAMDLIVASDDARFLPAHLQYFTAPWEFGTRKAKEILWQARFVDAREAKQIGMVNDVVPRADLEGATTKLAEQIARTDPLDGEDDQVLRESGAGRDGVPDVGAGRALELHAAADGGRQPSGASRREGRPRLPGVNRALRDEGNKRELQQ